MLHKLSKYLVGIGTFLFVAMFPVGELYAQYNLETITNKELFAYPPKSSLRATRWLRKADKFKAEGNVEKAVLYYTKAAEKGDARAQFIMSLCYNDGYGVDPDEERSMYWLNLSLEQEYALAPMDGKRATVFSVILGACTLKVRSSSACAIGWKTASLCRIAFSVISFRSLSGRESETILARKPYSAPSITT